MKRIASLLLCVVTSLAAVTAQCEPGLNVNRIGITESFPVFSERDIAFPFVDEPITITVMAKRSPNHPNDFSWMWFTQYVAEKTNITLDYTLVEPSAWEERKNLAFASGDYPDVFMANVTIEDEMTYGPEGVFIDLLPYILKYAPNTLALYERWPDIVKGTIHANGKIYMVPMISYAPGPNRRTAPSLTRHGWTRWAWRCPPTRTSYMRYSRHSKRRIRTEMA